MAHKSPSHSIPLLPITVLLVCLALWIGSHVQAQSGSDITNVYDELGRLVAVIDSVGETAVYTYDAVGNLLSISRFNSSVVSIIHFSPNKGPVGTPVIIYGTSFSPTASQNSVTFNGIAATVTSATTTQIVTSVPSGATTGPIAITTPTGSATNSIPFAVTTSAAPTITGFTPTIGSPGAAVTITGTNFEPTPSNNWVTFNNSYALTGTATATTISTSVPTTATSGRVSAVTPAGKAVSVADFFVPPSPYTPTDVEVTGRIAFGESKTVTISTANKIALLVFSGTAGQRVSLQVTNSTFTGCVAAYDIIKNPDGSTLAWVPVCNAPTYIDTMVLPLTGSYTILIDPEGSATGSQIFVLNNVPADFTGTITPGGSAVTVTTTVPGQNAQLTFSGTVGQRVSLVVTNSTFAGCISAYDTIKKPDGSILASAPLCNGPATYIDTAVLPVTGSYTILIDPQGSVTGSQTLTLNDVPADFSGTITPGGAAVTVTITTAGQNGQLTFSGTAGQRVSLQISNSTFAGCIAVYDTIKKPDDTTLASVPLCGATTFIDTVVLPVTGSYTILIDPQGSVTGSQTLMLNDVPADFTSTITPGGSAVTVTITTAGQNGLLTFAGTAGQRVSLQISNSTFAGCVAVYDTIKKPDGTTLASVPLCGATTFIDTVVLPVTGSYTILIDPQGSVTGSQTLTLNDVPADFSGTITPGGAAVTVTITTAGQNGQLTFSGTATQQITVHITNNPLGTVTVTLRKPDGSQLTSSTSSSSSFNLATQTLPTTGTYTISIDPAGAATGSLSLNLEVPGTNLALNKTATQSSTAWGGTADRAVDGNTNGNWAAGSVTHTAVENQAWWHVDLGSVQSIATIDVWNRTDCCGSALTNFYVLVSDQPFTSTDLTTTLNQSGVWNFHNTGQAGTPTSVVVNRTGRYVRIQLAGVERISLAEVQVFQGQ